MNTDIPAHSEHQQTLLVLGAGPKAIAIAAKRAILAKMGYNVPRVVIVDRQGIAAHWSGEFGFTDGRQVLGTRPEKDIGYPYASTCWETGELNRKVNKEMQLLSWHSYLIDSGGRYSDWVASHIQPEVHTAEVVGISSTRHARWQLSCMPKGGTVPFTLDGDGLVITGPGVALTIPGQPEQHPRIMDGGSFWTHVDDFDRMRTMVQKPLNIGIIGIGETAAAIILALLDALKEKAFIEVISPYGVLYSRDEGFEENKLFSDPDGRSASLYGNHHHAANWLLLSEQDRREFVRRTDRGVFSLHAMEEINRAENVRSVGGTTQKIEVSDDSIVVDIKYGDSTQRDEYDYVIVARGFDPLAVVPLLAQPKHSSNMTHSPTQVPSVSASTLPAQMLRKYLHRAQRLYRECQFCPLTLLYGQIVSLITAIAVQLHFMPHRAISDDLQWQASSDGIMTNFSPSSGSIGQGQQQQVVVYIYDACPYNGTLLFSIGDDNLTVPVQC